MLSLNEIEAEDGLFETTYDDFSGTDLNELDGRLIIDIVDTKFPRARFSKELLYLFVQLDHVVQLCGRIPEADVERCTTPVRNYVFSLRDEGFFVFDNEVNIIHDQLLINWSFQRKLPVGTNELLIEIQEIYPRISLKALEIIQSYKSGDTTRKYQ